MIEFANLSVFLLTPLPLFIRHWLKPRTLDEDAGLKVPFYPALNSFAIDRTYALASAWLINAYFVWFLLVIAAAGPQWLGKPVDLPRSGRDILLAIDVSGSMQIPDMEMNHQTTDRLTVVKKVAEKFVKDRSGDRLGLILFGSNAYLETPLTFDLQTVTHMLHDASVGLAGTQTAIGDAIGMAIKHFKQYPNDNKVLILLTDGVNNEGNVSPLEAAEVAAKYGIRIYTVGLAANQVVVPSLLGSQVITSDYELDESTLKKIAKVTHGIYFRAKNPEDLTNVYQALNKVEPRIDQGEHLRPKTPLYYWPLGLAFILVGIMLATVVFNLRLEK